MTPAKSMLRSGLGWLYLKLPKVRDVSVTGQREENMHTHDARAKCLDDRNVPSASQLSLLHLIPGLSCAEIHTA